MAEGEKAFNEAKTHASTIRWPSPRSAPQIAAEPATGDRCAETRPAVDRRNATSPRRHRTRPDCLPNAAAEEKPTKAAAE